MNCLAKVGFSDIEQAIQRENADITVGQLAVGDQKRTIRVNGQFIAFPTYEETAKSDLDLVVAGKEDGVAMIEGFSKELPEQAMGDAIMFGHQVCLQVAEMVRELVAKAKEWFEYALKSDPKSYKAHIGYAIWLFDMCYMDRAFYQLAEEELVEALEKVIGYVFVRKQ